MGNPQDVGSRYRPSPAASIGSPPDADEVVELVALMGAPGSGKSALAASIAERRHGCVVSLDSLPGLPRAAVPRVISAKLRKTIEALSSGRTVVFDSCLTQRSMRGRVLGAARIAGVPARLVFLDVPLVECLRRQEMRERRVPAVKVADLHDRAGKAWVVAADEGWDRREVVYPETRRSRAW